MDLLHEIAHCSKIQEWFDCPQCENNCSEIIRVQQKSYPGKLNPHQIPEPWNGDIQTAKILFIGLNPALDIREVFPLWRNRSEVGEKKKLEDFFTHRLKNGPYAPLRGEQPTKFVDFWDAIRLYAGELLGPDAHDGVDYAITEAVHCKSQGGEGVEKALETCAGLYLKRVVELSTATVLVVFGEPTKKAMIMIFPINEHRFSPQLIAGRDRYTIFLKHPAHYYGYKGENPPTFKECLGEKKLRKLQEFLSSEQKS